MVCQFCPSGLCCQEMEQALVSLDKVLVSSRVLPSQTILGPEMRRLGVGSSETDTLLERTGAQLPPPLQLNTARYCVGTTGDTVIVEDTCPSSLDQALPPSTLCSQSTLQVPIPPEGVALSTTLLPGQTAPPPVTVTDGGAKTWTSTTLEGPVEQVFTLQDNKAR